MPPTREAARPKASPARLRAAPSAAVRGALGEPDSPGVVISERRHPVDRLADHRLALIAVDLEGEEKPVREDGGRERLDVVGQDVVATLESSQGLRRAEE